MRYFLVFYNCVVDGANGCGEIFTEMSGESFVNRNELHKGCLEKIKTERPTAKNIEVAFSSITEVSSSDFGDWRK